MTREAKVGMLTGLGVIVLIGVLLSKYLNPQGGITQPAGPTNQMADLGIGQKYRDEVMQPMGVPPMIAPGVRTGASDIVTPVDGSDRALPPAAFAVEHSQVPLSPTPVTPIPAGQAVAVADTRLDPPTISVPEPMVQVKATETKLSQPVPTSTTYIVAQGDSLGKIAKKFYNSSKNSDVQRIVAANPGVLKDATTMLVVGKKLTIPGVILAAASEPKPEPVQVLMPGDLSKGAMVVDPARKVQAPAPVPAKTGTYVVQSGDTLEKISRRIAPSKVSETVQKLMSLNGIKDPSSLKVGAKLKVPA